MSGFHFPLKNTQCWRASAGVREQKWFRRQMDLGTMISKINLSATTPHVTKLHSSYSRSLFTTKKCVFDEPSWLSLRYSQPHLRKPVNQMFDYSRCSARAWRENRVTFLHQHSITTNLWNGNQIFRTRNGLFDDASETIYCAQKPWERPQPWHSRCGYQTHKFSMT